MQGHFIPESDIYCKPWRFHWDVFFHQCNLGLSLHLEVSAFKFHITTRGGKRSQHSVYRMCNILSFCDIYSAFHDLLESDLICIVVLAILHICLPLDTKNVFTMNLQGLVWVVQRTEFDAKLMAHNFKHNVFVPEWKVSTSVLCVLSLRVVMTARELKTGRKESQQLLCHPHQVALSTHNQFPGFCSVTVITVKASCTVYTF